jgi:hypothetical protein
MDTVAVNCNVGTHTLYKISAVRATCECALFVVNPLHLMFYDKNAYTSSQLTHGFCAFGSSNSPFFDLGNFIC